MAMIGTTGSGKTTALRQLLDGIEARGDASLVYDTSGEFIANYYRPERGDVILNPFDDRCAFWTPFAEIAHPADCPRGRSAAPRASPIPDPAASGRSAPRVAPDRRPRRRARRFRDRWSSPRLFLPRHGSTG